MVLSRAWVCPERDCYGRCRAGWYGKIEGAGIYVAEVAGRTCAHGHGPATIVYRAGIDSTARQFSANQHNDDPVRMRCPDGDAAIGGDVS